MTGPARWAAVGLLVVLAGCTTVTHRFSGHDAEQVWTALVAVAESPHYDDWDVASNEVWVDERSRRIQVYREVRRVLYQAGATPQPEHRTWRLEISMVQTRPPKVLFQNRGGDVPAHSVHEAQRYFNDVMDLLAGLPEALEPSPQEADRLLDAMGLDERTVEFSPLEPAIITAEETVPATAPDLPEPQEARPAEPDDKPH